MKKGLRYLVVSVLLLGVFALNVSAAEENGCPGHGGAIAVGASQTLDTQNATYYLTNDITDATQRGGLYDGFNVTADNVTLCMNGYNIIPTRSAAAVRVADNVKGFVLCNCQSDRGGVVTGKGDNRSMLLMPGSEGAIYKGVHLDNNTTVTKSAAVQVNGNASFSMFGGSINNNGFTSDGYNNSGVTGALVGLSGSTINLIGGEILNNDLTTASGATMIGSVVSDGGTVTMQEGFVISGNRFTNSYDAKSAGGVYVTNGTFTMNGGTITNNTGDGGGVLLQNSTMTMAGGVISGNKQVGASLYNAQVVLNSNKAGTAFSMSSGTISTEGKTANALVFLHGNATISGGTVDGNMDTLHADGPFELTIAGGKFSDETELDVLIGGLKGNMSQIEENGKRFWQVDADSAAVCDGSHSGFKVLNDYTLVIFPNGNGKTISTSGNYYLAADITKNVTAADGTTCSINVTADNVTLCLGGYSVLPSNNHVAIHCSGKNLKIVNCSTSNGAVTGKAACSVQVVSGGNVIVGDNVHIDNATNLTTAPVVVEAGGSFTMVGGSISTNKFTAAQTYAGGAICAAGNVTLYSGTISNNKLTVASGGFGGGAITMTGGTLTMAGKSQISKNTSGSHGGGVALYNASVFDMSGGVISENTADDTATNNGGGVEINGGSTFTMTGGSIEKNIARNSGGGVNVTNGTFNLSGTAKITANKGSSQYGAGVCLRQGEMTMNGGEISQNIMSSKEPFGTQLSCGLYGGSTNRFTMNAGTIKATENGVHENGNEANGFNAVAVCHGTMDLKGGTIVGDLAVVGVLYPAELNISGGAVEGKVSSGTAALPAYYVSQNQVRKNTRTTISGGKFSGETELLSEDGQNGLKAWLDDSLILSVAEISEGNLDYEVRRGLVYNGAYMDFGSSLDFGLNLVADVGDCTEVSGYTLALTGADADVEPEILIKEIEGSKQLFVMARGIAAKEMRNDITFTLKKDGEVWFTKTTSVYDAANEFRAEERQAAAENGTEANDDYLAMLGNMIYYGTQAQRRFGYNLRTLLNKPDFAETSGGKAWTGGDVVVSDGDASKVSLSLSLKEQIELNFYIRDPQARISNVTFAGETIPASDYTVVQATGENDGYTMISFREIPITKAKEMAQFTVTLPNATTFDVSGGIASYVKLAQNDSTEAALVSALRNYVESVYTVFATVPEAPVAARVSVEEL